MHGGCIFTLADTIGGSAALTHGVKVVTLDSTIHYLKPALHTEKLIAEAREIKYGSTVAVYEVSITNAEGDLLSTVLLYSWQFLMITKNMIPTFIFVSIIFFVNIIGSKKDSHYRLSLLEKVFLSYGV